MWLVSDPGSACIHTEGQLPVFSIAQPAALCSRGTITLEAMKTQCPVGPTSLPTALPRRLFAKETRTMREKGPKGATPKASYPSE